MSDLDKTRFTLTTILDSVDHDILVVDDDQKILFLNMRGKLHLFRNFTVSVGDSFEDVLKKLLSNVRIDNPAEFNDLVERTSNDAKYMIAKIKLKIINGSEKFYEVSTSPIYDNELGHLGRIWQFRDITEVENIEKMKTEFLSIASHQLRTPITMIRGFVEMIENKEFGEVPYELHEPLDAISKASSQMNDLVSDLLNISRIEKGEVNVEMKKMDLVELVKNLEIFFESKLFKKNQFLKIDISVEKAEINGNSHQLDEVIKNLVDNAIKYSPESSLIKVQVTQNGNDYVISIKDRGVGIPENQKNMIFTKFFRANNVLNSNFEGTGLGLYFVKKVIDQHKGDVSFESMINAGTTFIVRLPKSEV